tara:strand:- start:596 stop:1111 length:516 start_codon:yes stop_codon:yes gene_type:complete
MKKKGLVVWITGLSGAGKTTIAKKIATDLKRYNPIHLDGDDLREILTIKGKISYSKKNREKIGLIYAKFTNYIAKQGNFVIVSVMALNNSVFLWNKTNIKNYFEVYLNVPNLELIKRDPKGIYKSYKKGKLKNISGFDISFDEPTNPHLKIDWKKNKSANYIAKEIIKKID